MKYVVFKYILWRSHYARGGKLQTVKCLANQLACMLGLNRPQKGQREICSYFCGRQGYFATAVPGNSHLILDFLNFLNK